MCLDASGRTRNPELAGVLFPLDVGEPTPAAAVSVSGAADSSVDPMVSTGAWSGASATVRLEPDTTFPDPDAGASPEPDAGAAAAAVVVTGRGRGVAV
jgi:hypothetical protein